MTRKTRHRLAYSWLIQLTGYLAPVSHFTAYGALQSIHDAHYLNEALFEMANQCRTNAEAIANQ